jgi:hypothetical protein
VFDWLFILGYSTLVFCQFGIVMEALGGNGTISVNWLPLACLSLFTAAPDIIENICTSMAQRGSMVAASAVRKLQVVKLVFPIAAICIGFLGMVFAAYTRSMMR